MTYGVLCVNIADTWFARGVTEATHLNEPLWQWAEYICGWRVFIKANCVKSTLFFFKFVFIFLYLMWKKMFFFPETLPLLPARLCVHNFNPKHMRKYPHSCCFLMSSYGTAVCREIFNFAKRPGTITSRLLLCNRPFPTHNAVSAKTSMKRQGCGVWWGCLGAGNLTVWAKGVYKYFSCKWLKIIYKSETRPWCI